MDYFSIFKKITATIDARKRRMNHSTFYVYLHNDDVVCVDANSIKLKKLSDNYNFFGAYNAHADQKELLEDVMIFCRNEEAHV